MKRNKLGQIVPYSVNHNYFVDMSAKKYWLLGLLAADGCVLDSNRFSISQSGDNGLKLIKYIKSELQFEGKIHKYKNAHSLYISSRKIIKKLKKYKIVPNKTLRYNLPHCPDYKSFIRGYFEGDGCVGVYNNKKGSTYLHASFVGTKQFINVVQSKIPFESKKRHIKKCQNLYELRWNGKKASLFLKWLYSNISLYRSYKQQKFINYEVSKNNRDTKYTEARNHVIAMSKNGANPQEIKDRLDSLGWDYISKKTIYNWRYKYV